MDPDRLAAVARYAAVYLGLLSERVPGPDRGRRGVQSGRAPGHPPHRLQRLSLLTDETREPSALRTAET